MGTSPQQQAAEQSETELTRLAANAYPLGFSAIRGEQSGIAALQAQGGEPSALREAFGGARAGLLDAAVESSADSLKRERQGTKGAALGGNIGASMATPTDMGATLARSLYGSRITEATGALEEQDKLLGMSLGQSQVAGSGSLSAFGNALGNIPLMQNYNSTYGNVVGALNLGASLYGAGQQAGLFSGNPGAAAGYGNPFAGAASTASAGFEGT